VTREAVETGFARFVDEVADATMAEFDVAAALRGSVGGPGSRLADRLLAESGTLRRRVVDPELREYRERALRQFEAVLDAAESDDGFDDHADRVLAADSYWEAVRSDVPDQRRATVREALLDRNRRLAGAVTPLLASPRESFWPAVTDALDEETAVALVEDCFAFTEPLVDHRGAFRFETTFDAAEVLGAGGLLAGGLPTVRVEFTDEAIRAMHRAEQRVIHETVGEVRRRFEDGP
jgi:hypothetical protein